VRGLSWHLLERVRWVPFTGFFRERGLSGLSKQFGLWLRCAAGGGVEEVSVEGERSARDSPAGPSIRPKQGGRQGSGFSAKPDITFLGLRFSGAARGIVTGWPRQPSDGDAMNS
jgi:hypothetical protein